MAMRYWSAVGMGSGIEVTRRERGPGTYSWIWMAFMMVERLCVFV